jgi:hypothetical protein
MRLLSLITSLVLLSLIAVSASAVCPVCTVAVAGGVGIMRAEGVDDIITGVWFGALIMSSILWTLDWLNKRKIRFLFKKIIVTVSYYAIFVLPLYLFNLIAPSQKLLFLDKFTFGIAVGTFVFLVAVWSDGYVRRLNGNKLAFTYQKVIIPITFLIITSIVSYLLIQILG